MSSSISGSEAAESGWRGYLATFAVTSLLVFATLLGLLVALDPYDSGRPALVRRAGVPPQGPRTADASRGRDLRFDSAIFGNSHIQLIRPETLDADTGLRFVSLAIPATYPKEQLVLIDWFMRHHPDPAAIVIGLDNGWCIDNLYSYEPFPYWLYDRSPFRYLFGLVRYSALEHIPGRFALLLGGAVAARPDGYNNYESDYRKLDLDRLHEQLALERPAASANPRNLFISAGLLRDVLDALPSSTRVILAWPPVHISALPKPDSDAEKTKRACHSAFSSLAANRPRTAVVDWAMDRTENRQVENFFDQTHYVGKLAEAFQKDIAGALNAF
jgi:hypothetical protein